MFFPFPGPYSLRLGGLGKRTSFQIGAERSLAARRLLVHFELTGATPLRCECCRRFKMDNASPPEMSGLKPNKFTFGVDGFQLSSLRLPYFTVPFLRLRFRRIDLGLLLICLTDIHVWHVTSRVIQYNTLFFRTPNCWQGLHLNTNTSLIHLFALKSG